MVCVIVAWQKTSAYFYRFPESEKRGVTRRTKQVPMFFDRFPKFISATVSSVRRASSVDIIIYSWIRSIRSLREWRHTFTTVVLGTCLGLRFRPATLGLSSYATICTNFAVVHGLVSLQWVWGDCALISRSKEGARPPQHAYVTPFESWTNSFFVR